MQHEHNFEKSFFIHNDIQFSTNVDMAISSYNSLQDKYGFNQISLLMSFYLVQFSDLKYEGVPTYNNNQTLDQAITKWHTLYIYVEM